MFCLKFELYEVTKPILQIMEIREAVEDASGSRELNQIQSQVLLGAHFVYHLYLSLVKFQFWSLKFGES